MADSVPGGTLLEVGTRAPEEQSVRPTGSPAAVPGEVRAAAVVLAAEGAALIALGVALVVETVVGAPTSLVFSLINGLLAMAAGVLLVLFGRSFLRLRRWTRTPAALIQVLALPVAWSLGQAHHWLLAAAVAVPALVVLYLLSTPAARVVFHRDGYAG